MFTRLFLTMRCMWYETNNVVMERHVVHLELITIVYSVMGPLVICVHTAASLSRLQTLLLPDSTNVMILSCIVVASNMSYCGSASS